MTRQSNENSRSGVTRGTARVTPFRGEGDTRPKINFLRLNLERTLDKLRGKMAVVRRRQLKKSSLSVAMTKKVVNSSDFFQEKIG